MDKKHVEKKDIEVIDKGSNKNLDSAICCWGGFFAFI